MSAASVIDAYLAAQAAIVIDHLCRNRACVNPSHMEPVTNRENIRRGDAPAGINARKTHCKYGHEFTPANTRMSRGRRQCRICIRAERARGYLRRKQRKQAAAATDPQATLPVSPDRR